VKYFPLQMSTSQGCHRVPSNLNGPNMTLPSLAIPMGSYVLADEGK